MFGNAHADGLARRVRQPPRHFLGRLQDEHVGARRGALEPAVLPVVDAGKVAELGQVAAHQRQVVAVIDAAQPAQALDGALVVEPAGQRIAGIGRQRNQAALLQDLGGLIDQARLRIERMDLEVL